VPRENYIKTTKLERRFFILYMSYFGNEATSKRFQICRKTLLRWWRKGEIRKKGSGRSVFRPEMETKLLQWIRQRTEIDCYLPLRKEISQKAKLMTKDENFLASKGWNDRFYNRNREVLKQLRKEAKLRRDNMAKDKI
jgi:hypothetical protein